MHKCQFDDFIDSKSRSQRNKTKDKESLHLHNQHSAVMKQKLRRWVTTKAQPLKGVDSLVEDSKFRQAPHSSPLGVSNRVNPTKMEPIWANPNFFVKKFKPQNRTEN